MSGMRDGATKYGLFDSFSLEGYWWTSGSGEEESTRVPGTLSYDPFDGAILRLFGVLKGFQARANQGDEPLKPLDLLGFTRDGKEVTLRKCLLKDYQDNIPGFPSESFRCQWVLIGGHIFSTDDECRFHSCRFSFDLLEDWLATRPFSQKRVGPATEGGTLEVSARFPPCLEHRIDNIGAMLSTSASIGSAGPAVRSFNIEFRQYLILEPDTPKPFAWFVEKVSRLRDLASLCYGRPIRLAKLTLFGDEYDRAPGYKTRQLFDLFFGQYRSYKVRKSTDFFGPLLRFPQFMESGESPLSRWFETYGAIEPVFRLFFTTLFEDDLYLEVRFLLTVQAIEIFHRLTVSNRLVSPELFDAVRTAAIAGIAKSTPADLREKLESVLAFGNEPSLRQRLRKSVSIIEGEFGKAPFGLDKALISAIVDTPTISSITLQT